MSYIYLFYSKHLIKKIRAIITLFILFLALFSPNVLAAKSSDESVSLDERIIKQFSVAGIKLGMGEEEAAQKLKQLANKTGGVFLNGCVIRNNIMYICVGLSDKKISKIHFHASLLDIPYWEYGMDKNYAKKLLENKYEITLNENSSYEGDKLTVDLSVFNITFKITGSDLSTAKDNNNKGVKYLDLGKCDKAMPYFNKAIELDPTFYYAYLNRGNCYTKIGNYNQALSDYNKAIELKPKLGDVYYDRGNYYSKIGNYNQAISDYNKAIELNPKYGDAYVNRGFCYGKISNYNQAIIDYSKAIELNPNDASVYVNRGNDYSRLGNYDQALNNYNKAVSLDPKNSEPYACRALGYAKLGNYQSAINDINKALELNSSGDPSLYNQRGYLYFDLHDYNSAIRDLNSALALIKENKEKGDNYIGLAISYYQLKNLDLSQKYYNNAIQANSIFKQDVSEWEKAGYSYTNFQKEIISKMTGKSK